jgi:hypothetical protein
MRSVFLMVSATVAMAQSLGTSTNNSSSEATAPTYFLCNGSISEANASGIVTHNSRQVQNTGSRHGAPDHSWAITVTGGNGQELERRFWYDTAGVNYADDVGIDTDVCAFPNFYMPLNAHQLGQDDPGDCSTVLSQHCIDSVTAMAAESALKWTTYSSPPPYENLTAGVLPSICRYISEDLKDTIKKECGAQMRSDDGTPATFQNPAALTGYNSSILYENNCTLSAGNKTLHYAPFAYPVLNPGWETGSDEGYDNITNAITPILTVYMPVANVERMGCCNAPNTVIECLRARDFNETSRVAPALAAGTPWPKPGALSAGAKGGVAAGVVVFVLAVAGCLLFLWIAKRKKRARAAAAAAAAQPDLKAGDDDKDLLPPEADAGFSVHELAPRDRKSELDSMVVSELGGGGGKPSELANTSVPAELSAENPRDIAGR